MGSWLPVSASARPVAGNADLSGEVENNSLDFVLGRTGCLWSGCCNSFGELLESVWSTRSAAVDRLMLECLPLPYMSAQRDSSVEQGSSSCGVPPRLLDSVSHGSSCELCTVSGYTHGAESLTQPKHGCFLSHLSFFDTHRKHDFCEDLFGNIRA
jgi:hypothetical protein